MKRKAHINQLMEEARAQEKDKLNQLKNTLYDQQRKMQVIQADIESISQANSVLEQDFEYEINKKNQNSKEIGQIINSINNIFNICAKQQDQRGKSLEKQNYKINEETKNLVELMNIKLDKAHMTADELHKVFEKYGNEYDRDKAYAEDIEAQNQSKQTKKPMATTKTSQVQRATEGNVDSTGQKTGKINNAALGTSQNLTSSKRSG